VSIAAGWLSLLLNGVGYATTAGFLDPKAFTPGLQFAAVGTSVILSGNALYEFMTAGVASVACPECVSLFLISHALSLTQLACLTWAQDPPDPNYKKFLVPRHTKISENKMPMLGNYAKPTAMVLNALGDVQEALLLAADSAQKYQPGQVRGRLELGPEGRRPIKGRPPGSGGSRGGDLFLTCGSGL
jgi:hypothetical protein